MLTIYGVPLSVHTRKVILAARLKDIAYENEPVIPFDPPKNWRSLSPTGLIPAISHGGFRLADSGAICAYLERIGPDPSLYPKDAEGHGRALWLEQFSGGVLFRQVVHPLFHQKVIRPHILQEGEPNEAEVERIAEEVAPGVFGYLENEIDGDFLANGALTIADIAVASNLVNYQYLGFRIDAGRFPKLAGHVSRIIRQTPFRAAFEAEAPFADRMGLDRSFLA